MHWGIRGHYDWAIEAFHEHDEQQQLEELASTLGLPARQVGNMAAVAWRWRVEGSYPDPPDLPRLREIWARAALAYDSDRVEPIHLGGLAVVSLDVLPEIVATITDLISMRVDFATVLLGLGFDFDDARFLQVNKVDGLPAREVGTVLGWDSRKVEAVRRRCARKAANLVRTRAGVLTPQPAAVKVGAREWPAGVFERLSSGRLILRTPE
ncbi:MAG: hypothetical protein AAB654_11125 [Acidobacteriota bacterium]